MIGEIIKSTEALRYHAKTAEIAGQNLAHVNDESYARQRVLSREGLMSKAQGGLNTSSLEGGGLDHARNELLDKRVFSEFGESANLEAQKEILSLLQAALGESVDRQAVSGGLDADHESNLSAGGLARALDDLFNAFQELSASPDEATAKEEIINKIKTLTKRFNDAGSSIDEIDSDLSVSVESAVKSVNRLLDQIYEANLQIKRFELLDQGKAVTYRDNRQGLLEDLSKLINFNISPEVDAATGRDTGFWNLSTFNHQNQKVDLLTSEKGVTSISKDFGNIINLENKMGDAAQVRAKIAVDGTLGHIEVLDGGSQYDDTEGPILFAIAPPVIGSEQENISNTATVAHSTGEVFSQGGKLYQAMTDTLAGSELADESLFLEISSFPPNGQVFPETLRRYSDLENFEKGEQIYFEGKLYQAAESVGPTSVLKVDGSNQLLNNLTKGEVFEIEGKYFQALQNKNAGDELNSLELSEANIGEQIDGLLALGETPPQQVDQLSYVPSVIDGTRPDRWFLTKSYQAGDFVKFNDQFFQFTNDAFRGQEVDELSRAMQALTYDQTRSYSEGDFVEIGGNYRKFTGDVTAFADDEILIANLSEIIGEDSQPFDGLLKNVEDPNFNFVESNGSYKISDAFREFQLSGLTGSEQTKRIKVSGLSGDESDVFSFDILLNGVKVPAGVVEGTIAEADAPSFSITGFNQESFPQSLKDKLLEIEEQGTSVNGVPAVNPAFDVLVDETTGDLLITGLPGLGEFELVITSENNAPEAVEDLTGNLVAAEDLEPAFTITPERDYLADKYNLVFTSESFGELPISVAFQGDATQTAQAIADAVAEEEALNNSISAIVSGGNLTFRAKEQGFEFSVDLAETDGIEDLHNIANNQIKLSTNSLTNPLSEALQTAEVGQAAEVSITNFPEQETIFTFLGENDAVKGVLTLPFLGTQEATIEELKRLIEGDATLNNLVKADPDPANPTTIIIAGKDPASDFINLAWDDGVNGQIKGKEITARLAPVNQVDQISDLSGLEQSKEIFASFVPANLNDQALAFTVTVNNQPIQVELPGSVDPLDIARFDTLLNSLDSINQDGTQTADGSKSTNPAFSVAFDYTTLSFSITGNSNTGNFEVAAVADGIEVATNREFISDNFIVTINDGTGVEIGSVEVSSLNDAGKNALAIADAINLDPNLNQSVIASLSLDGEKVVIEGKTPEETFSTVVSVDDKLNDFSVTQLQNLDQSQVAFVQNSGAQISRVERNGIDAIGLVTAKVQSLDFKKGEEPMIFKQNDLFYFNNDMGETIHFVVTAPTDEIDSSDFDPLDAKWANNFKILKPKLLNDGDPSIILRKAFPTGHNLNNGSLVELNFGLAEAVVKKGEITGFNILNSGNGLPGVDSVFADGQRLLVESGAIKGYQDSRTLHLETFRTELNDLVSTFVEEINVLHNPDDQPGAFVFGFDAVLTRPVSGRNLLMEEEYGYYGREGDASIELFRDEVDMTLPRAENETFSIVNTTPIFSEEFAGDVLYYRGGDNAETTFRTESAGDLISFYASADKMQNVTMESDSAYPGADLIVGTEDDGRSLMMAYETIPFRLEGLEEGSKLPIIGDNFNFTALPSNPWNLATSLKVDKRLSSDSLLSGNTVESGSNEIALAIAELGEGNFISKVSVLNANMGNTIADLNDNLDHQKSIETLLLDQRRAVSSVSIDEEVADLMRFQRSFQASSRVLTTLDKMLEIVVMGLIR